MEHHDGIEQLLHNSRSGRPSDLDALLAAIRPWVRQQARLLLNPAFERRLDGSDIAQDVCLRAARGFAEFQGTRPAQFFAWIDRILHRVIIDEFERHRAGIRDLRREVAESRVLATLVQRESSPEQRAVRDEQAVALAGALEQLPPHQREVLEGRFFDQRSFAELATAMGKSEGALRVVCLRALRKLQELLGDEP